MNPLGPGDPLRLGPYRLIGVLGAGGMGQVYLGRDSAGRTAAVKVLRPEFAHDQEMARRFVREAQAAEAVRSKGVARVLGAHTEGGRPWIATEFLAGPTLDEAVDRHGPFADAGLRALGSTLALTLQDIHQAGLVHRDLKPSNIVLTSSGPRIIDFGIARPEHGLTLTTTGQAPVTPGYGAPEQVLGRRTGPAADVFSLGAVLAYAASGRRAYDGGHVAAVQYEVVHGEPYLDEVPPPLRPLIEPCLAKEASLRPAPVQIAGALAPPRRADTAWREGALADEIAQREADAERLAVFPSGDSGEPRPNRRRAVALLAAGGTVAVAALGGGAWMLSGEDAASPKDWEADLVPETALGDVPARLWGPVANAAVETSASPMPVRDLVVVSGKNGGLKAYGVTDGKLRWTTPDMTPGARYESPFADLVLGIDDKGDLAGINPEDGRRQWTSGSDAAVLLAVDEKAAYVLTRGGEIRAVSLDSRESMWTVAAPVRTTRKQPGQAAAGAGRLVLFGTDGTVAALDTASGREAWAPRKGQASTALRPAIVGETVYLGGKSLTAIDLGDGHVRWSHRSQSAGDGDSDGWTAPTVVGGALYAADGADLTKRRAGDGSQSWTVTLPYGVPPVDPPVVQGHSIWTALDRTGGAGIAAMRTSNGSEVWLQGAGRAGTQRMTGAGNRVFLLHSGELSALPVF